MKNTRTALMVSSLAGLTLAGIVSARITSAQQQGGPPNFRNRGFQGGGRGGANGPMPFAAGTITAGDANTGRITIQSQAGGNNQTIQVTNATQFVMQATITVADLQVNDQVQIQGIPTGITASSITAGQMPDFMQGGGRSQRGGNNPAGNQAGNNQAGNNQAGNNQPGQGANAQTAFASATGTIASTSPLTISLSNNMSLTVKLSPDTVLTKIMPTSFNNLKVGDRVMAMGQTGNDGTFVASSVAVNMNMGGGLGPGGSGRRGSRRNSGAANPAGGANPTNPNN